MTLSPSSASYKETMVKLRGVRTSQDLVIALSPFCFHLLKAEFLVRVAGQLHPGAPAWCFAALAAPAARKSQTLNQIPNGSKSLHCIQSIGKGLTSLLVQVQVFLGHYLLAKINRFCSLNIRVNLRLNMTT